jgi:glycosyltransferase involved in cell wall biosynthesis
MPVRNAADTLGVALASLTAQTLRDWELIAVPDRCSDDTPAILAHTAAADPRIRIVEPPSPGLVASLNAGLAAARAPFIARFDADDECTPKRLEAQLRFLEEDPDLGACGSLVRFGGDASTQYGYALHVEWINSLGTPAAIALNRFVESPVAHPSMMFRAELIGRLGAYRDCAWPEDYELWLRWLDAGVAFGKVPETLLTWNDPPQRLSRTDPRYSPNAFYACKCHYLAKWIHRERPDARHIFLWGAGRPTRRRFATLPREGIALSGYVDVDPKKIGGRADGLAVIGPDSLPPPSREVFVIAGVGKRGARERNRANLAALDYIEGRDFLCAA